MHRHSVTAAVLAVVAISCGAGAGAESVAECHAAAMAQAVAEDAYIAALTVVSDDDGHRHAPSDDHDHAEIEERVIASRVDVILATEATRRACQ
ncbi:MAG: hypothetical protein F4Y27_01210 [Acidimicrobiaceae bacterium]|nr:hypothetical protein [Acidimicrobiaceae bacterium]MXW62532.1 hypothetical protein [Acidimicrobiaceae bacterium]MXW75715.1 hypothetical protein [Acidimicrobiaceae bacterium]MYA73285.1 hypothetical protein [Acidimicrobiaceae bacterium]MYC43066.1 hypothetical protein [Acidimicrobiaceae bacterium]